MTKQIITQRRLKELLHYDPCTGIFTWIISPAKHIKAGAIAGCVYDGYIRIRIEGGNYRAHRLAFLYIDGFTPNQIDHINHIRSDNRFCNLRSVTTTENSKNQSTPKNNSSGVIGVCFDKSKNKWRAYIGVNKTQIKLGEFASKSAAIKIRAEAEVKYGYHRNHGST